MTKRDRYTGPLESGMVVVAPGNDGNVFRRDLLLCEHPMKPGIWIYEALPCPMRKRIGSGVGEISTCPELNIRLIMRPETPEQAAAFS